MASCSITCCKAKVSLRYAAAVAVIGFLVFSIGIALVVFGAMWDSITSPGSGAGLYFLQEKKDGYTYDTGFRDTYVLMYQGLLVCIPVITAFLQLCKRVRSSMILFLLTVFIGLTGSFLAASLSGKLWMNVQVVYQSYGNDLCQRNDTFCSCRLPRGEADEKTAFMSFSDCSSIRTLHDLCILYFALAVIASFLLVVGMMVGCAGYCSLDDDRDLEERMRIANAGHPCWVNIHENRRVPQLVGVNSGVIEPSHVYTGGAMAHAACGVSEIRSTDRAEVLEQQENAQGWANEEDQPLLDLA